MPNVWPHGTQPTETGPPSSAIRLRIAGSVFLLQLTLPGNTLTGTPEVGFHGDSWIMVKTALLLTFMYIYYALNLPLTLYHGPDRAVINETNVPY